MPPNLPNKSKRTFAVAGAIVLALAFGFGAMVGKEDKGGEGGEVVEVGEEVAVATEISTIRHPLTGLPTSSDFSSLPRVYAVMIDNSVDAWPVAGADKAFLVIEAPVEAAIPRLEAFFSSDVEAEKIGPVRSARPYFIDWAAEFDALYAHVGGSDDALDLIATTGAFDLNEYYNGSYFWRSSDRFAPHNTYTSTEKLAAAVVREEGRGRAPEALYGVWGFKGRGGEGGTDRTNRTDRTDVMEGLEVSFNSDLYTVRWEYDAASGKYLRSQGGRAAVVENGTRLTADNVAAVVTDMEVLDAVGRREVRTTGEGKAWLLQDGVATEVVWKKPSSSERLAFYGTDGSELPMNPGITWIEVIPNENDAVVF